VLQGAAEYAFAPVLGSIRAIACSSMGWAVGSIINLLPGADTATIAMIPHLGERRLFLSCREHAEAGCSLDVSPKTGYAFSPLETPLDDP